MNSGRKTHYVAKNLQFSTTDNGICKNPDVCGQGPLITYPNKPFDEVVETEVVMEEVIEEGSEDGDRYGVFEVIK